ncbi:dephospho-CoA kinase [Thermoflavimicrobium dichotomicum]|uniref:Dephospho-CoA kinase n=1 Tax=Thermoflavimicrobium dichotomicum TaxID=46223 RepID=A0A1I3LAR3_9BACL|nr:dephospho-CoA kinase [Thermoflavimicrobium dichotomicum]SFI81566.1 dephospho-CoA kinase [Thermoflavimicrobium dichotomicum]
MRVGLTGGIATGKSTVSQMFRARGAYIVDADQIAREVVEPGTEGARKVREQFGDHVFFSNGQLNRAVLGEMIFKDRSLRFKLNQILHPIIMKEMEKRTNLIYKQDAQAIVIWDVPLLIEENLTKFVEKVIVVYIPESIQLERLMKRNQLSKEEAYHRIAAQLSIEEKRRYADFLIDNSRTLENTERQVDQIWNYLKSRSGSSQP